MLDFQWIFLFQVSFIQIDATWRNPISTISLHSSIIAASNIGSVCALAQTHTYIVSPHGDDGRPILQPAAVLSWIVAFFRSQFARQVLDELFLLVFLE